MDYHAQSTETTLTELRTTPSGLTTTEVARRLDHYGPNMLRVHGTPLWRKIIEPFNSVFVWVLFVAAGISLYHNAYIDAAVIVVVILISAVIYYVQEYSTERILRSLRKHSQLKVTVIRHGKETVIDSEHLVPGDIVRLEEGDKIPADARIIDSRSFRVDESQLTGESLPIEKSPKSVKQAAKLYERTCMVYQGSFTVSGAATIVVCATGTQTEFGRLSSLATTRHTQSPVQKKIDKLIEQVVIAVGVIAIIAFGILLARGSDPGEALQYVIALAVSAVPEGLPVAISVILALGMKRMARKRALVRNMAAIESVGTVTTIATDKTGTLTRNKLTVQQLWSPTGRTASVEKTLYNSTLPEHSSKVRDPLDVAFDYYHAEHPNTASKHSKPAQAYVFETTVAMSGNLWHNGVKYELWVKGAPEKLIARSSLTENEYEQAMLNVQRLSGQGYRVIALAHTSLAKPLESLEQLPARTRFEFDGLVAIADTLRPEAHAAIKLARKAGISVRMITGDHVETAYQIGRELGLVDSHDQVLDSRELDKISDGDLTERLRDVRVFARVIPEQKYRILSILNKTEITAMTGDGVNDVPALTNANIGLAMGSGVQIAKDASDIVLLDDNFKSIVSAVEQGRIIYSNIKRMVVYLLSTNLGEVLVSIGSLMFGMPLPMTPIQLLWINLVTDTSMVIPLGVEPGERNNMSVPPAKPTAPLLNRFMVARTLIVALTMTFVTLSVYSVFLNSHGLDYARTIAFNMVVVMQWASAFGARSNYEPIWRRLLVRNHAFYIGLALSVLLQLAAIITPLADYLHISHVSINDLALTSALAFVIVLVAVELHKWVGRRFTTTSD